MPATVSRLLLIALATPLALMATPPAPLPHHPPALAESYLPRYAELRAMAPVDSLVAKVQGLDLVRDAGRFTLTQGTLTLLSPVGGQTVAASFHGKGVFTFVPPTRMEKDRLIRFEKTDSLSTAFTDLILLFTDSSLAELRGRLKFGAGSPAGDKGTIKTGLDYLGDDKYKSFDPDFMADFLNGEQSGLFYAYMNREDNGPLMFLFNPYETESNRLWGSASHGMYTRQAEVISQFPARGFVPDTVNPGERLRQAEVTAYKLEAWLPQSGGGDLKFSAAAHLEIGTPAAVGPWISFMLYNQLEVDSARSDGGDALAVFKGKDDYLAWIHLPGRIEPGKTIGVTLFYHGDLIDRFGDFFFIKSASSWYPVSLEGRSYATFDLTFHSPDWLQFACVGARVDSSGSNHMATTHWVTDGRIRNATFNLGKFESYLAEEPGVPPVTVLASDDAHKLFSGVLLKQKHMKETVGSDITSALKFFSFVYGPVPYKAFTATEIPYSMGMAFPGMIDLSWITFQETDNLGEDQIFRAHEVAHQWWGIGVDFTTYHDQWLSEGFSDFSGLWYLQTVRKDNQKYFDALDRWRANILLHRDQKSPIWLGYRAESTKDETGYNTLIYQKGAWVLHMLRGLMIDLKTMNEDRFTGMMRQFYSEFQGRRASTADFQRAAEQATGVPMDWFFNQWVYGYQIPTYKVATQIQKADGAFQVHLKVTQENVPDSFLMYVPVAVDLGDKKVARFRVKVTGHESVINLPPLPLEPKGVKFNDLDGVLAEVKTVSW